jgi:hypothetical protein
MSEDQTSNEQNSAAEKEALLESRKSLAREMGIEFHPSIGLEKLNAKIEEALAEEATEPAEPVDMSDIPLTDEEIRNDAMRLMRIRVVCMNPAKMDYEGEFFATGNKLTGTVRKYVHFGVEWHVPKIIYNMMKDKKFQAFVEKSVRTDSGLMIKQKQGRLVPEYGIEVLPLLSEEELKNLSQRQAMANGTAEA